MKEKKGCPLTVRHSSSGSLLIDNSCVVLKYPWALHWTRLSCLTISTMSYSSVRVCVCVCYTAFYQHSSFLWCATLFLFDNGKFHHASLHSLLLLCAVSNRKCVQHIDVCLLLWQHILSCNVSRIILAWYSITYSSRKHEQMRN